MDLIDDEVRPIDKIPSRLEDEQIIENEESGEAEEYDYQCYK